MKVILEDYGPVDLEGRTIDDDSKMGEWFNYAGHYLSGGTERKDAGYYEMKLNEMSNTQVTGTISGGEYDGLSGIFYLETDVDAIEDIASDGDFSDGPYGGWGE